MELAVAPIQARSMPQYDAKPTILLGHSQVLAALSATDDLRLRSGQQKDLTTDLRLILSRHNANQRRPVLVLLSTGGILAAAVIFSERQVLGFGIGLLRAGDPTGDGAVVAPYPEREAALLAAMDALLSRLRFHTAAATLSGLTFAEIPHRRGTIAVSALRPVRRRLPLSPTLGETLRQRFTPRKRKNLLYYLRTLAKTYEVEFVPCIPVTEAQEAILQLSQHSWPHRTAGEIAFHSDFLCRHPESFCMGIRLADGVWLSLITGWRIDGITHMPWQLNHADYKDKSLMQVMRTRLMEHECALGQTALSWVGGTVSFRTACEPEVCLDVLKTRRGLRSTLLRRLIAPFLFRKNPDEFMAGSLMLLIPPEVRAAISARPELDAQQD